MASIKGESSGNSGVVAWRVALAFFSCILVMNTITYFRIDDWVPHGFMWVEDIAILIVCVVVYGLLQGFVTALLYLLSLILEFVQYLAGTAERATERLLTALIESGAQIAMMLMRLPALVFIYSGRWIYNKAIAPVVERRRQRAELRKLYEQVKGSYKSFEDFLRDFERGADDDSADEESEPQPEQPRQPPPDPFIEACKLLGLPTDGTFSEAELKQRYSAMMKAVHPDVFGPNTIASQVNQARDIIRKRKGWQ